MSGDVPEGWVETKLGDIASLMGGFAFKSKEYSESGIPILRMGNISKNFKIKWTKRNQPYVDIGRITEFEKYLLTGGEIVICLTDMSSTGEYLGTVAVNDKRAFLNQRVSKFVFSEKLIEKDFLFYKLCEPSCRSYMNSDDTGSIQKNTNHKHVLNFKFPLPPLPEQKRIAAKLDCLLSKVDACKARLDKIPGIIKRFRQSVLADATSGKLTADWREGNSELNIWDGFQKENSRCIEIYNDKKLSPLPKFWMWLEFQDVATIKADLRDPKLTPDAFHIAPNHIEAETGRLLNYTTVFKDGVKSPKHQFYPGQILYSKIRPYLCKVVIVDFEGLCSADMYPISSKIYANFLHKWMLSFKFTDFASQNQGRTVLPKINQKALNKLPVPVPPIEEQREISRRVEALFTKADQLEQKLETAKKRVDRLTAAILAKAFRGELVPQDPNDEPASELLKRIRAEREKAAEKEKAGRGAKKKTRTGGSRSA